MCLELSIKNVNNCVNQSATRTWELPRYSRHQKITQLHGVSLIVVVKMLKHQIVNNLRDTGVVA